MIDTHLLLWGNNGQNMVLPVNSSAMRRFTIPTEIKTAFCPVSFNEFAVLLNGLKARKPVECVAKLQFNDLTREMAGGNALLVKIQGHLGGEMPDDALIGPDQSGDHWLQVHVVQALAIKRNRRDVLGPITNAIGQISTLRMQTIAEATQSGGIVSLQALMHEVGVNDKEMNSVVDAMRNPSYPLLAKWNLIGQVLFNAEKGGHDTKGTGVRLRHSHIEKLRQAFDRCAAGLADSLGELGDSRTLTQRQRGEIQLTQATLTGVLVAGTKTMDRYHKQNHHQKWPTTYVVNNDAVGRKTFDGFLKA